MGGRMWATLIAAILALAPARATVSVDENEIVAQEVKSWALRFGLALQSGCDVATCFTAIRGEFENKSSSENVDPTSLLLEMRTDVKTMMSWKAKVISSIRDAAESAVMKYSFDPDMKINYFSAKSPRTADGKTMEFYPHKNYGDTPINTSYSVVHVPTNVYDQSPDVLNAIKWSEELNTVFSNNLIYDSSLIYQFFGSATGFLRLYPAIKWRAPVGPDMYDCRMRPWYIQGAASPKDIVILLDGSGSMTGLRKEIARNVVLNILETLSENDFVTILRFSENVKSVVPCFENTLVQATEGNLREFRELLRDLDTVNIANFTLGLISAFELLQKVAKNHEGSNCNQAIMLITDGAPYTYEPIFAQYNWPNIPVRVFTYLIGREVTDMDEVQWMACYNRGYYTHVTTLAEVREQVQKYIPVMSRPVVLTGEHPIVWSSVYADVTDVKLSDWLWQEREREVILKLRQKKREKRQKDEENVLQDYPDSSQSSMDRYSGPSPNADYQATEPEMIKKTTKKKSLKNSPTPTRAVQLLVTVSTPVFDRRNFSNVTERIRSSKNIWIEKTKRMRVANILGVAGTDVPIREIIKLTPPHRLGVNGYSFVITNNGFVLYHPDLRPLFQDMLKPEYNQVDMTELELVDDDSLGPRELNESLLEMKHSAINKRIGWKKFPIKLHIDGMRRAVTRYNSYYYGPIENTSYSLVIVLPEPYGKFKVSGQVEVKRRAENYMKYFEDDKWRVHPDWVYCEMKSKAGDPLISPENTIRKFLHGIQHNENIKWRSPSTGPPLNNVPLCDKHLVQSLVFDAMITNVDVTNCPQSDTKTHEEQINSIHGIVTTFVATRSGLLRFHDHRTDEEKLNSTERPFYETHTRATDELFYRRAVDYYQYNSSAYVFAVPFDAGTKNTSLVTASRAIFVGKAPAAVVGVEFKHSALVERFINMTGSCLQAPLCKYKCSEKNIDCYLLDNNGFVVVSEIHEHTGKFFGEIDTTLFESLVEKNIFRKIRMFDYQAICIDIIVPSGPANLLKTPLRHMRNVIYWLWSKIIMIFVQTNVLPWLSEHVQATDYYEDEQGNDGKFVIPNKTRARPCDKEFTLYEHNDNSSWEPTKGVVPNCSSVEECDRNFIVQRVPFTNLIMIFTYSQCSCDNTSLSENTVQPLELEEVNYEEEERCQRMRNGTLRIMPDGKCVHHHPEEGSIGQQCGLGSLLSASISLVVGALLLCLL